MIKKNVYLMYRPGYSGSYINWAINISDADSYQNTVKDPINRTTSAQFGAPGTAHNHIRIPTHHGYEQHISWMLLNQPKIPNVYILNSGGVHRDHEIGTMVQFDRDGIFISIDGGPSWITAAYGYINGILKWPTRILAETCRDDTVLPFDPFNCADSIEARNWFVVNESERISGEPPVNYQTIQNKFDGYLKWYHTRNKYQPHEVNSNTYIDSIDINNRIFELSCADVSSDRFIDIFENIMQKSQLSDNYSLDFIRNFHPNYCQAQQNIQWFSSVNYWLTSGKLDSYLLSHSAIEACIVNHIMIELNLFKRSRDVQEWLEFYNAVKAPDWPICEFPWNFIDLPPHIQDELVTQFNYVPKSSADRALTQLADNWQSMGTSEINDLYQWYKISKS